MRHLAIALTLGLATPLAAQELSFSMQATDLCLDDAGHYDDCIGASAALCMEQTPGGYSTVVTGACYDAERQVWDMRLNAAYQQAMAHARQADAENAGFGPSQVEALRAMQRAWIPFRDRKCDYERSQWGGGTGGGPASIACLMSETARQTLLLDSALAEG